MMKILLWLALSVTSWDFLAPTYYSMIDDSDLIIHSQIIDQNDSTILVNVLETIKGESDFRKLTIRKFSDWTCAQRYDQYELGQEQIFILTYDEDDQLYNTHSAGNEGELPVCDGEIYMKYIYTQKDGYMTFLNGKSFLKCDSNSGINGLQQLVKLTKEYPSEGIDCDFLNYKTNSDLGNIVFEQHLIRGDFKNQCKGFVSLDFKFLDLN